MIQQEILAKLKNAVEEMDPDLAENAAREALAAGIDPVAAINGGLAQGMLTVSNRFDQGEAFVPQMLVAAEAFEAATAILTANLVQGSKKQSDQGKVLIHTVKGDVHDIGKNIVKAFLKANAFEVFDLGRDVPVEEVVEKALEYEVDIIAGSALMTTTLGAQKEIVDMLVKKGIRDRFILLFGGAPVTKRWIEQIGADGYAESPADTVRLAKTLITAKKATSQIPGKDIIIK
jgi:trimethylamine corrinoid protein